MMIFDIVFGFMLGIAIAIIVDCYRLGQIADLKRMLDRRDKR